MPPLGHDAQQTAADRIHAQQARMQIENKLRVKKGNVLDKERVIHEIEREKRTLNEEVHHLEQETKRFTDEVRKMEQELKQGVGVTKNMEMGLRETSQTLQHKEEEMRRIEREIEQLKQQIIEKERCIAEIKEETRHLARDKEEFRRSGELEHFTSKTEEGHLHEQQIKLQLLTQEKLRKDNELKHNEERERITHREMNFLQQEITQLEAELSHFSRG
jgi:chromosome segregation ATPase